jgi:hypothetical protein
MNFIFALNLILLSMDHIFTGGLALFFPRKAIKIYTKIFGAEIPETKEYMIILKPWGALGIFAGLVGILPIIDPQRYELILVALVALLFMRLIYRLRFQKDSKEFLQLSGKRNLFHVGLIIVCAAIIVVEIFTFK